MFESDTLQLTYRPDLDLLTGRWFADSPLPELREEYAAVLAAGLAHGTTRWLLDVRRRDLPSEEAANWVSFEWLPRAAAACTQPLRLAYLVSALRAEAVRSDGRLLASVHEALDLPQPYVLQLFRDEGEAVAWLTGPAAG